MNKKSLKNYLDKIVAQYNHSDFILDDPIQIPHQFEVKQDIEISGFWTAILSWGLRKTIINKSKELFDLMDNAPYDFIMNHQPNDLRRFKTFKHRTFQPPDTLAFIQFFRTHYTKFQSLESAFLIDEKRVFKTAASLNSFKKYFFENTKALKRTQKHVSSPKSKSTCKRINMFLRWMVRNQGPVDFGIWKNISPKDLKIPYDVHVERIAKQLGLVKRKQRDWLAVEELTNELKKIDSDDPVKYDYALFSLGVNKI